MAARLVLEDAPVFDGHTHFGAMAVITLPILPPTPQTRPAKEGLVRHE